MKLSTNDIPAVTSKGVKSVSNFSINASAQAFSILSSGLYKNPVKAIIRELSTNAIDSHVEAGNPDKYDVEIPTRFSPVFRIRDYGTGLSKDDVIGLYSTYFGTTKTESNEQIGALGLGSKSPLGYTNSFSVVSYFNGVKYNFSIFIGEDGFPNIALTGEFETDEKNGLEIIIPAKNDIDKWNREAKEVYKYFDTLPNFMSNDIVIDEIEYRHEYDNIKVKKDAGWNTPNNLIQGNIAYPFDFDEVEIDKDVRDVMSNMKFDIFVDIGSVSFLPNREEISYDIRTKATIARNVKTFTKNIKRNIKKEIDDISIDNSFDEIKEVVNSLNKSYSRIMRDDPKLMKRLVKKVFRVSKNGFIVLDTNQYNFGIKYDLNMIFKKLNDKAPTVKSTPLKKKARYVAASGVSPVFWINDSGKRILSKFKGQIKEINNFLIHDLKGNSVKDLKDFICEQFNVSEDEIKMISEFAFLDTPAQKALKGVFVKTWKPAGGWYQTVSEALDNGNEFVWVENKAAYPTGFYGEDIGNPYRSKETFAKIVDKLVSGGVSGVKPKDVETVKKMTGWIHINDYIEKLVKEKSTKDSQDCFNGQIEHRDGITDICQLSYRLEEVQIEQINNKEVKAILQILKAERSNFRSNNNFINTATNIIGKSIVEKFIDNNSQEVYNTQSKHEEDFIALIQDNYDYLEMFYKIVQYDRSNNTLEKLINLINTTYLEV